MCKLSNKVTVSQTAIKTYADVKIIAVPAFDVEYHSAQTKLLAKLLKECIYL